MIFRLEIDTSNAAFDGSLDDVRRELTRCWLRAMDGFLVDGHNPSGGNVRDTNGNTVGRWSYTAEQ